MASYTSCRCTGTSLGATIPSRTLSPRISTTVTVMSLLMTILSFFFLDSTSIAAYPSQSPRGRTCGLIPTHDSFPRAAGGQRWYADEDTLHLKESEIKLGRCPGDAV